MDLWKNGMILDSLAMIIPHPEGLVDAGVDNHFVTS